MKRLLLQSPQLYNDLVVVEVVYDQTRQIDNNNVIGYN